MEVWNKQVRMQPVDITLRCLVVWIVDFVHILAIHIVLSSNFEKLLDAVNYPFSSQYFLLIPPWKDTSGNQRFSDVFKGDREWTSGRKGLRWYFGWNFLWTNICDALRAFVTIGTI